MSAPRPVPGPALGAGVAYRRAAMTPPPTRAIARTAAVAKRSQRRFDPVSEAETGSNRRWLRFATAAVLAIALVGGGVIAARRYATPAPSAGPGTGLGADMGTLTVNTTPTGAEVVVDDQPR